MDNYYAYWQLPSGTVITRPLGEWRHENEALRVAGELYGVIPSSVGKVSIQSEVK